MARETQAPRGVDTHGGYGQPSGGTALEPRAGRGWVVFAAVLFIVAGVANALWGISALANDDYFAADELLFGDLSMWGAFYLVLAVVQLSTALLILRGSAAGAVIGIMLAIVHATVALMSIAAYPLWTVIVLALDGLIIYGLTVYGFDEAV